MRGLSVLGARRPVLHPYIALKFGGETTLLDPEQVAGSSDAADAAKKITWGGSVMWLGSGLLGFEGDLAITPGYFSGDAKFVQSSRVTTLLGNVVVAAPLNLTRESLRPYASAGWGLMRAVSETDLPFSRNLSAFNVGGGVIGMLSRRTGVRWDRAICGGLAVRKEAARSRGREAHVPGAPAWPWSSGRGETARARGHARPEPQSPQREGQFDRDGAGHRTAEARAGREAPLFGRL